MFTGLVVADERSATRALRDGNLVALMRHAEAPGPVGDPANFKLEDCATQRNLSEQGRATSRRVGAELKRSGARIARVLSSPWCRCLDTARLLDVGPVEVSPAFRNAFVLNKEREVIANEARAVITSWQGPGTLLVVTHGANIASLIGINPAEGEIVVLANEANGRLRVVGRLPAGR
jgi:phosphohistidine phosphatase SixA